MCACTTGPFHTETLHYLHSKGSPFLHLCLFTVNQAALAYCHTSVSIHTAHKHCGSKRGVKAHVAEQWSVEKWFHKEHDEGEYMLCIEMETNEIINENRSSSLLGGILVSPKPLFFRKLKNGTLFDLVNIALLKLVLYLILLSYAVVYQH